MMKSLVAAIGEIGNSKLQIENTALRSPGLLAKHYSPKAKLAVMNWRDEAELATQISNRNFQISNCHFVRLHSIGFAEEPFFVVSLRALSRK